MSNVNNYKFANLLQLFQTKVIDPQIKRVEEAQAIMDDSTYQWKDKAQKESGEARLKSYKDWLAFYQEFHRQGMELVKQHEGLTNNLSKWYDKWREDVSNEGKQEVEIMSSQADFLNEIFSEIYRELLPLKLEGMKAPAPLNLK